MKLVANAFALHCVRVYHQDLWPVRSPRLCGEHPAVRPLVNSHAQVTLCTACKIAIAQVRLHACIGGNYNRRAGRRGGRHNEFATSKKFRCSRAHRTTWQAIANFKDRQIVYTQGDTSDSLFYILSGTVKSTLVSEFGKEALISILGAGDFSGEGCLDKELLRNVTITATGDCEIARFDRAIVSRALVNDPEFAGSCTSF